MSTAEKTRRLFKIAGLIVVAFVAAVEAAWGMLLPTRVPSEEDWRALSTQLHARWHADEDIVLIAPDWLSPIGRHHLGNLVTIEMAGHTDLDRYARVWVAGLGESKSAELTTTPAEVVHFGRLTLTRYERKPAAIAFDFTTHAKEARVVEVATGATEEKPCLPDPSGSFRCTPAVIEPRTLEIDYRPRRGILAPAEANKIVRIEFSEVELGKTIVGYTGLHDYYARKQADGPVDFVVFIDGAERLRVHYLQSENWRRFSIDTEKEAGKKAAVRFEVSSPAPSWRSFGFHAEARK